MFEHIHGNFVNPFNRELTKEYGKTASVIIRLCKEVGVQWSNQIVIADSWFADLSLVQGLRNNRLHLIRMIKQEMVDFPKRYLVT